MIDNELAPKYRAECLEHLATIEADLRQIKLGMWTKDRDLVNRVTRTMRSVTSAALFLDLVKLRILAQRAEEAVTQMSFRKVVPGREPVDVLLCAVTRMRELVESTGAGKECDTDVILRDIDTLFAYLPRPRDASAIEDRRPGNELRMLVVEDDFASMFLLQSFLSQYGLCRIAATGSKAVEMVGSSLERGEKFDLICLDVMMPGMDGLEVLRRIRALENSHGIPSHFRAKIIMTTAVSDADQVLQCLHEFCDSYILKPIDLDNLLVQMKSLIPILA
jgi:two-component system, chemotaxis family, chemotaxis protein CheY